MPKTLETRLTRLEAAQAARTPSHCGYLVFADEAALQAYQAQPSRSRERLTAFLAIASPDTWDEVEDETT